MGRLDELDLTRRLKRSEQDERLAAGGRRLAQLRLALGGRLDGSGRLGPGLAVVMEGWDASGKGGAIKRIVAPIDNRHVRIASYAAPTDDELRHHYLLRFASAVPGLGGFTIFDRSWYGRVLVERVEGLASEDRWRRAYDEIAGAERSLAAEGTIIVKFWMHISAEEQLRRFQRRERDPLKAWKITEEDWRNREKRPEYVEAVEEMLVRTDLHEAPWILVEAESKRYARVRVLESLIDQIERGCAARGFALPDPIDAKESTV
ncbi:UDP-galactose-lipid carrier transferase [Baekduia soli]|uniref:UDP-galactose-lipid carrier transferase n=1 Tax=Baekduia soli TaxID=496014 RepID=A0A5B8U130_9ACTN|nr:UDP-galactose-lipid carrier transferase [Baekduia soli]QEC46632.1 UDP-galactose-lipid carrier transferase [Baekduia soli]